MPPSPASRAAVTVAVGAFTANALLGASVAARLLDTSEVRWVHHGLFTATAATTCAALGIGTLRRDPSALALVPALGALVLLQRHGARPLGRHSRDALLAVPFYATALFLSRR
ncbi:hypothetical protein ACH0CV_07195 [Brachybacterium paraconglomeratum]|uniref:hypothetical protein n=1 Tax=Brachybacterium paraconglomeratum TaxID=173362 RepID=UPI003879B09C